MIITTFFKTTLGNIEETKFICLTEFLKSFCNISFN